MVRVTRRFLVTGKVQGVYFRHSTRIEAGRLGVHGVARNLPDGGVEIIAQGSSTAVDNLREWLDHGPAMARVAHVRELDVSGAATEVSARADVGRVDGAGGGLEFSAFSVE